ncbi:MAG: hypothetical protein RL722_2077 [Pseudomonadota bacterium]|jgi:hypothetical protein
MSSQPLPPASAPGRSRLLTLLGAGALLAVLAGCATPPPPFDYTAFRASKPASLLVLPPINDTPDVKATPGVYATATLPLAEAGYYVLPVAVVDETFKQNGLTTPNEIAEIPLPKLREIFGADAAVYLKVSQYGASYKVVSSETRVTVAARIVDLRNGAQLWAGSATASSAEQSNNNQGGLVGLLVKAVIEQMVASVSDQSFNYASIANQRLLGVKANGVLPGPRARPNAAGVQ